MEAVVLGLAGLAILGYGAYKLARKGYEVSSDVIQDRRRAAEEAAAERRWQMESARRERDRMRRLNLVARQLQLALLQLNAAPDFRRAASVAANAQEVPVAFRQRQFRRFRIRLIGHFESRLRAGIDSAVLTDSLTELLRCLGVSAFEAEYIRIEAERLLPAQVPQPAFPSALLNLQRAHQQRLNAIRNLAGLDDDTREQLIEAEKTRFREALERLGQRETPDVTSPTNEG